MRSLLLLLPLAACGSGDGSTAVTPRLWERQQVQNGSGEAGLAISAIGTVDLVYFGNVGGTPGVVWQTLGAGGVTELVAPADGLPEPPAVARDSVGTIHVVWGTSTAAEIRYAARTSAGWTVETIAAGRFRPALAVTPAGQPHVVFVDEATGNGMTYHAVRDAAGWTITPVHGTDWFHESQPGIVLTADGRPIVAAPDSQRAGIWVAEADAAGAWSVEPLAADRFSAGPLALASGPAGIAVAFKDSSYSVVAWRPAGATTWMIEDASHHDSSDQPLDVAVGPNGPMVVADVDVQYPNALALLERTSSGWSAQQLGPRDCDGSAAIAIDAAGEPSVALHCSGDLYFMSVVGRNPRDWAKQCEAAAAEMCDSACDCGTDGEDCCWGLGGNSTCTSSFGCPINGVSALCGDPTVSPEELQACRDALPSLTCGTAGPLELGGPCAALYQPFL